MQLASEILLLVVSLSASADIIVSNDTRAVEITSYLQEEVQKGQKVYCYYLCSLAAKTSVRRCLTWQCSLLKACYSQYPTLFASRPQCRGGGQQQKQLRCKPYLCHTIVPFVFRPGFKKQCVPQSLEPPINELCSLPDEPVTTPAPVIVKKECKKAREAWYDYVRLKYDVAGEQPYCRYVKHEQRRNCGPGCCCTWDPLKGYWGVLNVDEHGAESCDRFCKFWRG